jgi:hypothetical protein
MMARSKKLQSKAGYIPARRNHLQRAAGPYIRVRFGSRATQSRLPLFPQQQTLLSPAVTSEKCQERSLRRLRSGRYFGRAGIEGARSDASIFRSGMQLSRSAHSCASADCPALLARIRRQSSHPPNNGPPQYPALEQQCTSANRRNLRYQDPQRSDSSQSEYRYTTKEAVEDFVWDTSNMIVDFNSGAILQSIKEIAGSAAASAGAQPDVIAEQARRVPLMPEAFICLLLALETFGHSTAELESVFAMPLQRETAAPESSP